jgi:hypothetical protein
VHVFDCKQNVHVFGWTGTCICWAKCTCTWLNKNVHVFGWTKCTCIWL